MTNLTVSDSGTCYVGILKCCSRMTNFFLVKQEHIHHTTHQNTFLQWCKQSEICSRLKRSKQSFDEIRSRLYYKQSLHHFSLVEISSKDHQKVVIGIRVEYANASVLLTVRKLCWLDLHATDVSNLCRSDLHRQFIKTDSWVCRNVRTLPCNGPITYRRTTGVPQPSLHFFYLAHNCN